jgi:hypothetical protein
MANAIGTFGNFGKNNMCGPGMANTDFSMLRSIKITEHKQLQLRAEFFNVFNHANFGRPDSNWSDGTGLFGAITSAAGPAFCSLLRDSSSDGNRGPGTV